jgi:hypothetical protein
VDKTDLRKKKARNEIFKPCFFNVFGEARGIRTPNRQVFFYQICLIWFQANLIVFQTISRVFDFPVLFSMLGASG